MEYDLAEHRHRFAVWAAARAAQRGFTTVSNLRAAVEDCGVREFLRTCDPESIDAEAFEQHHRAWCGKIISRLSDAGVKNPTYGRAAKLIGVYLKSMVILGGGERTAL